MASSLRGVRCNVCNAWGSHDSKHCPKRNTVGVPVMLQGRGGAAPDTVDDEPATTAPPPPPPFPPLAVLGPQYLTPSQLATALECRADVPPELTCAACDLLAADSIWCRRCGALTCEQCLGPGGCAWQCPVCCATAVDDFAVVPALRNLAERWFVGVARIVDPYSVDSGGEEEPDKAASSKRRRRR